MKPVTSLVIDDLRAHSVWQYANGDEVDDTLVMPVKDVPLPNLEGKLVAAQVRLANGTDVWGLIGNVDSMNPRSTEHFLTLSVFRDGQSFTLARYHDLDYAENGPEALARFLGLSVDEVFPIVYDIRAYAKGDPAALAGKIHKEPRERLSRAELIKMAVP